MKNKEIFNFCTILFTVFAYGCFKNNKSEKTIITIESENYIIGSETNSLEYLLKKKNFIFNNLKSYKPYNCYDYTEFINKSKTFNQEGYYFIIRNHFDTIYGITLRIDSSMYRKMIVKNKNILLHSNFKDTCYYTASLKIEVKKKNNFIELNIITKNNENLEKTNCWFDEKKFITQND